jgi:ribonuclease-3
MDLKKHINEIEQKIGYKFCDKSLLVQAFTRSSYCNEKNYGGKENLTSNEVLEFFGDSVLSTVIVSMLLETQTERYEHGIKTSLDEGGFSLIRSRLSDKKNLSKSMALLGLEKYLLVGEGDDKLGIQNEPSVMEDLFESIIGAIYIDSDRDIATVSHSLSRMLDVSVYTSSEPPVQNPKNALQEWCADKKNRLPAPVYKTVSESGPDHKKSYERGVYIGDRLVATGVGKNQKIADTAAAERALEVLRSEATPKRGKTDVLAKLRAHASQNKLPSPEFRDLGETPTSNEYEREYIVECRYSGLISSGVGRSKQEARESACESLYTALTDKNEPESSKKTKAKKIVKKPTVKKIPSTPARRPKHRTTKKRI